MVKRRLNVKKLGVFIGIILVILLVVIFGIKSLIDENNLRKTTDYKLSEIGYTANEISLIKELKKEEIDTILKHKYNVNITKLMKEKYFIFKNLDKYLDYITESSESNLTTVVAKVNTNASMGWYKTIIDTDTSKKTSMLVNKFYKLSEDYIPDDLIDVSATYGYQGKQVSSVIYDELTNLIDAAKEKGYSLIVTQGYRSYKDQLEAYDEIESSSGQDYADEVAARAGHSEYQTGLSVVVKPLYTEGPEHTWLIENAYKYGFILRYPKDKEGITGFSYDAWRLRYVGTNISRIIHNENITFDEYYAYYIK